MLAGPGSGKTKVIAHRIVNMIKNQGVPPTRILAISFTKASSVEMKKRTLELGKDEKIKKVNFGTFHSSFFRILRRYDGVGLGDLISETDRYNLIKGILKHLKITNYNDEDVSDVLSEISLVKNELMDYREFNSETFDNEEFQNIFKLYESEKKKYSKIDFDDMLIRTYNFLRANENVLNIVRQVYRYILIDEFQDINRVQFEVIKLISEPKNNVFAVGDEDQSIYGFRGARPDYMMEYEKYFGKSELITLDTNYRSRKNIVDISQDLIKNNKKRYQKEIKSFISTDGKIKYITPKDSDDEAIIIAKEIKNIVEKDENTRKENKTNSVVDENFKEGAQYSDFAVIYRTNRQARAFVDAFMDNRIPFILKDSAKSIYDHWVSLDIIAYLRAAMDIATNSEWVRIINKPFRYISKNAVKKASDSSDFIESLLSNPDIKDFQKKDLNDLYEDLNYIRGLSPQYAISYIRSTLDYDRYILEYCHERKIKSNQIVEILDELETSSKSYKTILDFFKHIDLVREEIKKRSMTNSKDINKKSIDSIMDSGVVLTTMHSAKGLEFNNVYVAGVNEGVIPYKSQDNSEEKEEVLERDCEEERRLLYVAITRAKNNLSISSPIRRFGKKIDRSTFLDEIERNDYKEIKNKKTK